MTTFAALVVATLASVDGDGTDVATARIVVKETRLIGTWTVAEAGIQLEFGPDNAAQLRSGGKVQASGTFVADFSQRPHHLDIRWGKAGQVIKTIFEITAGGQLRMEDTTGDTRPKQFSGKAILLSRDWKGPP